MTVELFWDIASKVGLPFALVVLALLTGRAGMWVWGREIERERQEFAKRLADFEREKTELRVTADQEKAELRRDRDYFRAIAFEALNRAEGVVSQVEQAVDLVETRRRSR